VLNSLHRYLQSGDKEKEKLEIAGMKHAAYHTPVFHGLPVSAEKEKGLRRRLGRVTVSLSSPPHRYPNLEDLM
jgi:hypothetical protein